MPSTTRLPRHLCQAARVLGRRLAGDRCWSRSRPTTSASPRRSRSPTSATTSARSPPSPTTTSCSPPSAGQRRERSSRLLGDRSRHGTRRAVSDSSFVAFAALRGDLRGGERHLLRHLRRLPHLSAARARRQPADAELVGRGATDTAASSWRWSGCRSSTPCSSKPPSVSSGRKPSAASTTLALLPLGVWLILGVYGFSAAWTTRQDRRIAENPHWVLISSWWQVVSGDGTVRLTDRIPRRRSRGFRSDRPRPPSPASIVRQVAKRSAERSPLPSPECHRRRPRIGRRAVGRTEWRAVRLHAGPQGGIGARARRRQFLCAHRPQLEFAGGDPSFRLSRSSAFRDVTEEYPQLPGTSLASVFRDRGYRTAFVTPSDLTWAEWGPFLKGRGFGELRDHAPARVPVDFFLGRRGPLHGGRDDRLHHAGTRRVRSS